ncbi:hypothetical protein C0992_001794, partial [Termitomyces sp. T32_za158]
RLHPDTLDIRIIGAALFARILQEGAQAFQLHITPTLPEEHLRAEASPPTQDTEEETLHKVVPLEYHEFADVFSEGSAKELPLTAPMTTKSTSKKGLHPLSAKFTLCPKSNYAL